MQLKKALSLLLALSMLLSLSGAQFLVSAATAESQQIYTSASAWAMPEIKKAYDDGLIPSGLLTKQATGPATREELCELACLVYEKTSGKTAQPVSPNPFADTNNPAILKAFALGITTGTSATAFSPDDLTNREQVATMFSRAIRAMFPDGDYGTAGAPHFSDEQDISAWALDHVLYMSKMGIIKGADGKFMPKAVTSEQAASGYGTTTREQAIAISVRIYETYRKSGGGSGSEEQFAEALIDTAANSQSETEKLAEIDFDNRPFRPIYHPALTLSAQAGIGGAGTSAAPWTSVVSPNGNLKRTFTLSGSASAAAKIIWQVSLTPFDGAAVKAGSAKPGGLLLSGELSKSAAAFTVDFAQVLSAEAALRSAGAKTVTNALNFTLPGFKLPDIALPDLSLASPYGNYGGGSESLRTYYVRAYPADSFGNSIGDTGSGLPVLYGDPMTTSKSSGWLQPVSLRFSLKLARYSGEVSYHGEFPNDFADYTESALYANYKDKRYFVLPGGFPSNTQELRVQVSLTDFGSASGDSWRNVPGLVYETSLYADDPAFEALDDSQPAGIAIDFSQFVPSDDQLPEKELLRYYVRVAALSGSGRAGAVSASYSQTVCIKYGLEQVTGVVILDNVKIDPPIPTIESVSYTPVHWEAYDWQYHYVVTRQPTMKEVFGGFFSDEPYTPYQVGTKLDFTPQPEDKSWWEEAWDAITDFFGSIADFFASIVNWVSNAYANLKAGLINIVVSALPDSWQGPLRVALTALVDYGLASMGIPPTLPNFDELANMGTDYLATLAMEQAGVPAESLAEYGAKELAGKIGDSLTSSASGASPNPMNWDFVKLDPDYIYRPAYFTIELYNPYDEPTPAGRLSLTVDKFMDLSKNGSDPGITRIYAAYGSSYVCAYKPVFGMEIPSLAPGQRLSVPVILEEYVGVPFPGCTAAVSSNDYATLYGGLGEYDFNLYIQYDLPPVMEEAKKQGHTEDAIYSYSALGSGVSFTGLPGQSYSK